VADACQVDFYVLEGGKLGPSELACRLAMMAWERGQRVTVIAADDRDAASLDDLMWSVPEKRFLPHEVTPPAGTARAPVQICPMERLKASEVVINLSGHPVPEPQRFRRLLEIVPGEPAERQASRHKYRAYRQFGLQPATHTINK